MKILILTLILGTAAFVNSLEQRPSSVNQPIKYHGLPPSKLKKDSAPVYGRVINLFNPSRVELVLPGDKSYAAWAINPLVIIGRARNLRPGYIIRSFRSKNPKDTFRYDHKIENTNFDKNLDIYVIEIEAPLKLTRRMAGALQAFHYSVDALHFAVGVANTILESRYGPAPVPSAASVPASEEEPFGNNPLIKYHRLPPAELAKPSSQRTARLVNLFDPSRAELIVPGGKSYIAFAINPLVIIGRERNLRPGYFISIFRSYDPKDTFRYYPKIKNNNFDKNLNIYVMELKEPMKLTRPMVGALQAFHYSDDALHFAEGVANAIIESRYGPAPPPTPPTAPPRKSFPDFNQFF